MADVNLHSGSIAFITSNEVPQTGIPDELGRGYLSTKAELKGLTVNPTGAEAIGDSSISMSVDFIDDRSSFSKVVSWSAHAKFGFSGGGGSARASMTQSFRKSQRRVVLVLQKVVQNKKIFLRDPELQVDAVRLIKKDKWQFLDRYGDQFVRTVRIGGVLSIVYYLDFESMTEASDFRASAEGKYKAASGGVSIRQQILQTATKKSVKLIALVQGVANAPPMFADTTKTDRKTGEIKGEDKLAEQLMQYFDTFEESVRKDNLPSITLMETIDVFAAKNAPTNQDIDLSKYNQVLEDASELDDIIDDRVSKIEYMKDVAHLWNPQVDPNKLPGMIKKLEDARDNLKDELNATMDAKDRSPKLSMNKNDILEIPISWKLSELKQTKRVARSDFRKSWKTVIEIPPFVEGQPAEILVKIHLWNIWPLPPRVTFEMYWDMPKGRVAVFPPTKHEGEWTWEESKIISLKSELSNLTLEVATTGQVSMAVTLKT